MLSTSLKTGITVERTCVRSERALIPMFHASTSLAPPASAAAPRRGCPSPRHHAAIQRFDPASSGSAPIASPGAAGAGRTKYRIVEISASDTTETNRSRIAETTASVAP